MKKNAKTYCVFCGTKNEGRASKCTKCHKKLDPKDQALKNYVLGKIGGKVEDEAIKLITKFLKKYLYGIVMGCSVVFTGASIVANVVFKDAHIEKVTERPLVKYVYSGEGMTGLELVSTYVEAIKAKDSFLYRGLTLEKALPEVYEQIKNETFDNGGGRLVGPVLEHTLIDYGEYYFRDGSYHISEDEATAHNGVQFGGYDVYKYNVDFTFCSKGDCESIGGIITTDQIELLKVEDNFYVIGEEHHFEFNNIYDMIQRGLLFQAKGDTSNIDFSEYSIAIDKKYNFMSEEELSKVFPEH